MSENFSTKKCISKKITCSYHGRRFNNKGVFEFMPEFKETNNFPRECDNLHKFPSYNWKKLLFLGLNPEFQIEEVLNKIENRIGFLPLDDIKPDLKLSKDYYIDANWALYCDNYLEGFHVPFVHKDLNEVLDYKNYHTEIDNFFNLQQLPKIIGSSSLARELCLTARKFYSDEAKESGFVVIRNIPIFLP